MPDITFELLAKRQIRQLEEPSLECVDLVYEELLHLVQCCKFEMEVGCSSSSSAELGAAYLTEAT